MWEGVAPSGKVMLVILFINCLIATLTSYALAINVINTETTDHGLI